MKKHHKKQKKRFFEGTMKNTLTKKMMLLENVNQHLIAGHGSLYR